MELPSFNHFDLHCRIGEPFVFDWDCLSGFEALSKVHKMHSVRSYMCLDIGGTCPAESTREVQGASFPKLNVKQCQATKEKPLMHIYPRDPVVPSQAR